MTLKNKVAIVTGGNSGIGEAIALALAAQGARVVVAGRRQAENERVARTARERGAEEALPWEVDVSQEEGCHDLILGVRERFGRLDILVNNAGRGGDGKRIADSTTDALEATLRANLYSAYWCSREAFRLMAENDLTDDTELRGAILNTSSVCGVDAWSGSGIYCISKHGMMALTKAMADEGAESRIRVAAICPGLVTTPMTGVEGPDYIAPEDIAETVLYLLRLRSGAWPTEVVIRRRGAD